MVSLPPTDICTVAVPTNEFYEGGKESTTQYGYRNRIVEHGFMGMQQNGVIITIVPPYRFITHSKRQLIVSECASE